MFYRLFFFFLAFVELALPVKGFFWTWIFPLSAIKNKDKNGSIKLGAPLHSECWINGVDNVRIVCPRLNLKLALSRKYGAITSHSFNSNKIHFAQTKPF